MFEVANLVESDMNCSVCGAEPDEGAQFCGVCGTNLEANEFFPGSDQLVSGADQPMVGFTQAVGIGFSNYINFQGRATRAEYWWWTLFAVISDVVLGFIDAALGIGFLQGLFSLAILIPGLAVGARRLHDIGKSGWWQLLWFAIVVGWVILWVWAFRQGDRGQNQHGLDPRTTPRQ